MHHNRRRRLRSNYFKAASPSHRGQQHPLQRRRLRLDRIVRRRVCIDGNAEEALFLVISRDDTNGSEQTRPSTAMRARQQPFVILEALPRVPPPILSLGERYDTELGTRCLSRCIFDLTCRSAPGRPIVRSFLATLLKPLPPRFASLLREARLPPSDRLLPPPGLLLRRIAGDPS